MQSRASAIRLAIAPLVLAATCTLPSAAGPASTTDARGQSGVRNLDVGLAEVLALRPIQFHPVIASPGDLRMGLVAQEVAPLLPHAVSGEQEMLSVRYGDLVPVLIRAIQEQHTLIELQAERLRQLERQIEQEKAP